MTMIMIMMTMMIMMMMKICVEDKTQAEYLSCLVSRALQYGDWIIRQTSDECATIVIIIIFIIIIGIGINNIIILMMMMMITIWRLANKADVRRMRECELGGTILDPLINASNVHWSEKYFSIPKEILLKLNRKYF